MAQEPNLIEVSPGELLVRITILRIKASRIVDSGRLMNVQRELAMLEAAAVKTAVTAIPLGELPEELSMSNATLWDVEDEIGDCERRQDLGSRFVELARTVYRLNDVRGRIKRRINEPLGAMIVEEKQYVEYS